jgi:cysteinyl-tRNA synthetase
VQDVFGILEEEPGKFLEHMKRAGIAEIGISKEEIEDLIAQRAAARKARDFTKADEIRSLLLSKGIALKDTPEGTTWEKV